MRSALALRADIEASLAHRIPSALTPALASVRALVRSGVQELDEILAGGLPVASITEMVGAQCSGRTTAAMAYLAAVMREANVCAWIDAADAMDPETAMANGVDLERLLWVRCGPAEAATPGARQDERTAFVPVSKETPARHTGGGSPHPRTEARDMPEAIGSLLRAHGGLYDRQLRKAKRSIGTPGAPNRPLSPAPLSPKPREREEQVNSDRLPPRRGDNLDLSPRCAEPQLRRIASIPSNERLPTELHAQTTLSGSGAGRPWQAVDQALRATDLLLQGGGFSAIVLDLGGVPPEIAWRIPLATWFRFRAACERTRVSLLLLTQHPCARSSAELVVRLDPGSLEARSRVMTGIRYHAVTERSRSHERDRHVVPFRKPPQTVRPGAWTCTASWAQAR